MLRSFAPRSLGDAWPDAEPTPATGRARGISALLRWVASGILDALAAVAERNRAARAERTLAELDERMLRDIGITRTDIGRVVRYGRSG
jgi:uncharacterized protein YjiS (DUF1127 family)